MLFVAVDWWPTKESHTNERYTTASQYQLLLLRIYMYIREKVDAGASYLSGNGNITGMSKSVASAW